MNVESLPNVELPATSAGAEEWRPWLLRLNRPVFLAICVTGVILLSLLYSLRFSHMRDRVLDFTSLVAGGYLIGTPGLYDVDANLLLQQKLVGQTDPARSFPRLPHVGLLMRPFALLPYRLAIVVWGLTMAGCLLLFARMFPEAPRGLTLLAVCWSIPAFDALGQVQDSPLVLVYWALLFVSLRCERRFLAGLFLALCLQKYHLFLAVPVVLILKREWRVLAGAGTGAAILLGLGFAVQGWNWPFHNLAIIMRPQIDTFPELMPNVRGLVHTLPWRWPVQLALSAGLLVWVVLRARHATLTIALSLAMVVSFLIGHHAYIHDATLLLGPLLALGNHMQEARPWVVMTLSPLASLTLSLGFGSAGVVLYVLCLMGVLLTALAEVKRV